MGAIWKRPPFLSSSSAPNMLGESKLGEQYQSIEPLMPTSATVRRLPIMP